MVFHEITRDAIRPGRRAAPATSTSDLVDAQETRRILDRLYGYEVSARCCGARSARACPPAACSPSRPGWSSSGSGSGSRSAPRRYWDLEATLDTAAGAARRSTPGWSPSTARGSRPVATSARDGKPVARFNGVALDEAGGTRRSPTGLADATFAVAVGRGQALHAARPAAPFMTSTLQQEASRKLRMTAQTAMRVAQRLYENGYITYMRTDSTTLSESALERGAVAGPARSTARRTSPTCRASTSARSRTPRRRTRRSARPATRSARPGELAGEVSRDELALYDLIWKRTVASQMSDARGQTVTVRLGATASDGRDAEFSPSGTVITFRGFLAAYEEGRTTRTATSDDGDDRERRLPQMRSGDALTVLELAPDGHATQPPARYTEATLVKALEERGIGRPSTYASILGTILDRGYVFKRGTALVPSWLAFASIALAGAALRRARRLRLHRRDGGGPRPDRRRRRRPGSRGCAGSTSATARARVSPEPTSRSAACASSSRTSATSTPARSTPSRSATTSCCGSAATARTSSAAGDAEDRASVPEDLAPDELTVEKAEELLAAPCGDRDARRRPGDRPAGRRQGRSLSGRTSPRCCPTTRPSRRSRAPGRCSRRCRSTP